jgi:hypothetical protein
MTKQELCTKLGCSRESLRTWLNNLGKDEMTELYAAGYRHNSKIELTPKVFDILIKKFGKDDT